MVDVEMRPRQMAKSVPIVGQEKSLVILALAYLMARLDSTHTLDICLKYPYPAEIENSGHYAGTIVSE
jgi:hypothetical protein